MCHHCRFYCPDITVSDYCVQDWGIHQHLEWHDSDIIHTISGDKMWIFLLTTGMGHLAKKEHRNKVLKCRNYNQGKCSLPDQACWFLHDENVNGANENSDGNQESEDLNQNDKQDSETENYDEQESEGQNMDFHKVQETTPPDQINKIMNLINKLSLQVEKLEKMSI